MPPQSVVATIVKDGKGKFAASDVPNVSYKVVVFSDEAESIASHEVVATLTGATDSVSLAITLQTLYQAQPQFVVIYRQGKETGHYFQIARVAMSKAAGNVITFVDTNEVIPETTDVFLGEMNPQVVSLLELLPMMRLPLAQMNATYTFTVLWYGALALYAPKKWVRIKNVKYIPALAADVTIPVK